MEGVLDALVALSRRRWIYVVAAVLVTVAVVGPALVGGGRSDADPGDDAAATATTSAFAGDPVRPTTVASTTVPATTVPATVAPSSTVTPSSVVPATTLAPTTSVAVPETERRGDPPNPGLLYPRRPDIRPRDRERTVGLDQEPARFSGWSAWVARTSAETVAPDGVAGAWVKVLVRLVNRDDVPQRYDDGQWLLVGADGVARSTAYATPGFVAGSALQGNGETWGELWFPAPPPGGAWLVYRPDANSDRAVWAVP